MRSCVKSRIATEHTFVTHDRAEQRGDNEKNLAPYAR